MMQASGGLKNKKSPIFRLRTSAYSALSGWQDWLLRRPKSASLNAHLASSLNGLHKAFVSWGTLEIKLFSVPQTTYDASIRWYEKQKALNLSIEDLCLLSFVGMTRFELATTRPPDVYSNRAELHPEFVSRCKDNNNFFNYANLYGKNYNFVAWKILHYRYPSL